METFAHVLAGPLPEPAAEVSAYFEKGGRQQTPAYQLSDLSPGHTVPGPMLLIDKISCIVVRAPLQQCGFASMRSAAETAWKVEGRDCVMRAPCRCDSLASCGVVDLGATTIGVAHAPLCLSELNGNSARRTSSLVAGDTSCHLII